MEEGGTWVAKIDWRAQGNGGASRGGAEGPEGEKGVQGPHAEAQRVRGQSEGLTQRRRVRRGCGNRDGLTRRRGVRGECNDAQRAMICMHPCSSVVQTAFSIHLRNLRHLWLRTMKRPPEAGRGVARGSRRGAEDAEGARAERGAHAEARRRSARSARRMQSLTQRPPGLYSSTSICVHPRPSAVQ
jgi:hypothetical protein